MLDKILVDMISAFLGFVGLIGAITKYDFPKAHKIFYGENLFALKENIINNYVTYLFTAYAAIGILFQLIFGVILDNHFPERIHAKNFYISAFLFEILISLILVLIIKTIARFISENSWRNELSQKAKQNYLSVINLMREIENPDNQQEILKTVDWLEELFETKSKNRDLHSRVNHFKSFFDN